MVEITQLKESDFEEFIQNHVYAIVGFFSRYSSFCAAGEAHLHEVAESLAENSKTNIIDYAKIWVEDLEGSFLDYGLTSLPSFVMCHSGDRERVLGSELLEGDISDTCGLIVSWLIETRARDQ